MKGDKTKSSREFLWYKDAIIYELHIKAFRDKNQDGIGDFEGLLEKLNYIEELGITTIWLLPFFPSPLKDDGYDIADYRNINPSYGTISDFKKFLREAHRRNLKVIIELVINHTSDEHEWFQRARKAPKGSVYRNYYNWTDDPTKYKDARIIFTDYESSNWTWDPVAEQYYWHRFFHHQPDLNYNNPHVQREMFRIIDFWLNLGVDGFRLDAIPYLFEREGTNCENLPETHEFLKKLRKYIDSKYENILLLAEANMWPEDSASYFGNGDECHMNYHFPIMPRMFMAVNMENRYPIIDIIDQTPDIPETCQWATFLRNHDELTLEMVTEEERDYMYKVYTKDPLARINLGIRKRLAPLLDNDRRKIELLNVLLFSLPGTPVIYYGDEIGMGDNHYLGDRDGVRTPMQWHPGRNAGFSHANPQKLYLPLIIDPEYRYENINVEDQLKNTNSLLWWMRRLIKMRKRYKAFGRGDIRFLKPENPKILAFVRTFENEKILVVTNLSRHAQSATIELEGLKDLTPTEVFSQNEFPKIGNKPYLFTLSPYGYFWFQLKKEALEQQVAPVNFEDVLHLNKWNDLSDINHRETLESKILPPYLNLRSWFNKHNRKIENIQIFDFIPVISKKHDFQGITLIIQVNYYEGLYEKYRLAIGFTHGKEEISLIENHPECIISTVTFNGEKGILFDASYSKKYRRTMLSQFRHGREVTTEEARISFDITHELRNHLEDKRLDVNNRLLESKHRHVVIQYNHKFIIKMYRKIDRGTDRDVELSKYLYENGFTNVPKYLGKIEYSKKGDIKRTLAIVQEYISVFSDAWTLMTDALNMYYEKVNMIGGKSRLPELSGDIREPLDFTDFPSNIQELIGGPHIEHVRLLAQRIAEMHLTLGVDVSDENFMPEEFSLHYQRSLFSSYKSTIRNAFDLLEKYNDRFQHNHQEEIIALLGKKDLLHERMQRIYDHKIEATRIRPHGDLSLMSVMFRDGDFVITNFEGDFSFSLTERKLRKSALVDVASMLISFHYAAYAALYTNEPSGLLAEHWFHHISQIFLSSYRQTAGTAPFIPGKNDFDLLLETFMVEKYLNEAATELKKYNKSKAIIPVRGIAKWLGTVIFDL